MATVAMPAVPAAADTLTNLPLLLRWRDSNDVAHDLVSGDQGVLYIGEHAVFRHFVAVKLVSALQHRSIDTQGRQENTKIYVADATLVHHKR